MRSVSRNLIQRDKHIQRNPSQSSRTRCGHRIRSIELVSCGGSSLVSLVEHVSHQASGSERPHTAEVNWVGAPVLASSGGSTGGSRRRRRRSCAVVRNICSSRVAVWSGWALIFSVRSFRLFGKAFGISSQSPMRRPSTLVSLVSVSQFVPRMIPSQKLDSPASALISSHGLNLQPHYPLSRDASSERAPAWLPRIEFPWRIAFGAIVTFAVAVCFKTPEFQVVAARKYVDRQSRIAP